ncbi:phosphate ABC transporter ATP-binding protein, PhoT family [Salinihabitans flavidus]|uniref:Phosphate ABC transporter ATP-binding protein, PhoT family n=1 Tax=Salinihabitans flavidus TaxID=569882 RepID=A0A1H8PS50_9RHOB|nr:ATP-binding cassette domain-containing protein [Salinihabitans flavidus]SEO44606.1 phosphate ABC transporter ATP-binding protein, PhoT family [Salinihabitans flavidus]
MVGQRKTCWLELENVTLRRQGRAILQDIRFRLDDTGIVIVMGPNGAGKTTLLRAIHGLERIRSGTIRWCDDDHADSLRQAFVFQSPVLMRRSVVDCIAYPLRLDGVARGPARKAAQAAAHEVGLTVDLEKPVRVLSGGEKQKMALARALIRAPKVLFLDEPCANLDGRATKEIEETLCRVRDTGTRIIMSTHDIGQARRLAGTVLFLHDGRLVEHAEGTAFFTAPKTREAQTYLTGGLLL